MTLRYGEAMYNTCKYCQFPHFTKHMRPFPVCVECQIFLRGAELPSLVSELMHLIRCYRAHYGIIVAVKDELIKQGLSELEIHRRVKRRIRGERKVRGLMSAYKYHKLIEELSKPSEEQLRLKGPKS